MGYRLFGIRHHGPGCARSLRAAFAAYEPDCVLVEGPPDAEPELATLADDGLRPPVALLVYGNEEPQNAVFYPFALFSPEWQALKYAVARGLPARFIDLPVAQRMALDAERRRARQARAAEPASDAEPADHGAAGGAREQAEAQPTQDEEDDPADAAQRWLDDDPIALLSEAAGFDDPERFWDMQVEQRERAEGLFEAIQEAMTALRAAGRQRSARARRYEELREANMRAGIRKAEREGFQRIAVVCGAWHTPALAELGGSAGAKRDQQRLKGLPKLRVTSAWIPWTHSRLAFRSGYGAGVESPGWYAHVFEQGTRAPLTWAVRAARLLRDEDVDASSANAIETVRLAEALAVLRELPTPGLAELREAVLAALCSGDALRLALVRERLEIGEALGRVPETASQVPLQRDFEQHIKRLRLRLDTAQQLVELDLRKERDLERSQLLRRLALLEIEWGELLESGQGSGTFRESWQLVWDPEYVVALVSANLYGNTVALASARKLAERAREADLAELAALLEAALLAGLPEALADLLVELDARAAHASDIGLMLSATEPLARVIRYGDVRGTAQSALAPVFRALLERAGVGLVPAAAQLDDDAAAALLNAVERAHGACLLLDDAPLRDDWLTALRALLDSDAAHPRLRGRACRMLLDQQRLTREELAQQTALALSPGVEAGAAARFLEGLVTGEAAFVIHRDELVSVLDAWLSRLPRDVFQSELPILRRAFSSFAAPERRALGRKLQQLSGVGPRAVEVSVAYDHTRASRVLPLLAHLLGVEHG